MRALMFVSMVALAACATINPPDYRAMSFPPQVEQGLPPTDEVAQHQILNTRMMQALPEPDPLGDALFLTRGQKIGIGVAVTLVLLYLLAEELEEGGFPIPSGP